MERLNIYSIRKQFQAKSIEVRLDGINKLTVLNIASIKKSLLELVLNQNTKVYLNLQSLSFIDSSAVDCLNQISRVAQLYRSSIILTEVSQEVMELLNLIKKHSILEIHKIQPATLKSKVA